MTRPRVAPLEVRNALTMVGLSNSRRRTGPCPACNAASTKSDPRPPLVFGKIGWHCYACNTSGDGYELVGYHLQLDVPLRGRAFKHVLDFVERGVYPEVKMQEVQESVRIDPLPALRAATRLSHCHDKEVLSWLAKRKIPTTAPAGCLKGWSADWWPYRDHFPLVVPACTGTGEVVSMHGRSVTSDEKRWPKGPEARELLFAPPALRAWLRRDAPGPKVLVITEGLSDYLTWSAVSKHPTIGITSGGATALRLVKLEPGCEVFVGTDPDPRRNGTAGTGDRYAEEVAEALSSQAVVRRLPLDRVRRAA